MATNYTTLLGLALPTTGELDGTWGTTVNNSITQLVEDAIAETATASVSAGDWTLSTTGAGAANEARCAILIPTGTPGTTRNIIAPAKSKSYLVINRSDASVVIKTSSSTGLTIAAGTKTTVAYDTSQSDFVEIAPPAGGTGTVTSVAVSGGSTGLTTSGGPITSSGTITLAGTLAVGYGGTGATTATNARTNLGLGTMATQNSNSVSISGGSATLSSASITSATIPTLTFASGEYMDASSNAIRIYTDGTFNARFLQLSGNRQVLSFSNSVNVGVGYDPGAASVAIGFDTTNGVTFVGNTTSGYAEFVVTDVRKPGGGTFNASSDARLKENVVNYSKSLADINALRPVNFNYINTEKYGSKTYTGLIAQEVEQTSLASMVATGSDGYKILDTSELIFALVNAVKELSAEVQSLKAQINGG